MLKRIIFYTIIISIFCSKGIYAQQSSDTIRVMTYNILKYKGNERNTYLNTVVNSVKPVIIFVQEMETQTGVNSFAANVLNNEYRTIKFHDGTPDTESHIFYLGEKIEFLSDDYLSTNLRDIAEYKVKINATDETVYFYSVHLKASSGGTNEQKRLAEVEILRDRLDRHPPGTNFIVLGDFNIYYSDEPAYQKLIQPENNPSSQSFDPIDTPGYWHNNSSFSKIHTQSSRNVDLGDGGSPGGLDDRFDFILISNPLKDNVISSSYTSYGNDGAHFNKSINEGTNSAVGSQMADAIFYASDHLPLYCDFVFDIASSIKYETNSLPDQVELYQNYPNPFNPSTVISWQLAVDSNVELSIYNVLGERVATLVSERQNAGQHQVEWQAISMVSGIYYYHLHAGEYRQTKKMILIQ